MKTDSDGGKWMCDIPRQVPVATKQALQCPWCDRTFANNSALGSHKAFAHSAANEATKLVGTTTNDVGKGAIPLEVVNWTMLAIGKLEKELGQYAGAFRIDPQGRKIPVQPQSAKKELVE